MDYMMLHLLVHQIILVVAVVEGLVLQFLKQVVLEEVE